MKKKHAIHNFYFASKGKQDSNVYYEQMGSTFDVDFVAQKSLEPDLHYI